jgi:hypothetical protein
VDRDDLFLHLTEDERYNPVSAVLSGTLADGNKITPDEFITRESRRMIEAYVRIHRHGLQSLYPSGSAPESLMQAFDTIQNALDKIENDRIKEMRDAK